MTPSLAGRVIAVPESRELDVLENLFLRRGANVHRCPLVSIVDAPDPAPVIEWLRAFIAEPPDWFILLTGEGLRRLLDAVDRHGLDRDAFVLALSNTKVVSRGPKPARVLRTLGLVPEHFATQPTTGGVIETLESLDLDGVRVAVQLYGDDPNPPLSQYLDQRGARVSYVAPYRYAGQASEDGIRELVNEMAAGSLDAIVFTSQAQVDRLFDVAEKLAITDTLRRGLERVCVASIGPVVRATLARHGCRTDIEPEDRFFMKPLVVALGNQLGPK
ncbi:uroporphyrinogen-III synthase [Marinihelvus fidelis]|uniref:Uroporphyrinogen-III synthase n=1 Tax=Marinihelvus fidelis TaxID=2613842 RepID=A0A5N0T4N0_9GAMM|nr:uroporphyrinogen-III synthase [Marinihelvus fidelis]KAA9129812.1 uroporphyrinogen-III synthase [Marinihelvus fidelis]